MLGNKLYQRRAREALPILVRQALANTPITYQDLANELAMPNPRNLNYVLGSVGVSIWNLAQECRKDIPAIQCLVVNKSTGLPGEGFVSFLSDTESYKKLPKGQKRRIIDAQLFEIYTYKHWPEVLDNFGLELYDTDFEDIQSKAAGRRGGEGAEHKALKKFIAAHPLSIGLTGIREHGEEEHPLPSGDLIDVLFTRGLEQIAVEVKSASSGEADIVRGLYQCVKYVAVLEARQSVGQKPKGASAILVLGGNFPKSLIGLRNMLGVTVIDGIGAK